MTIRPSPAPAPIEPVISRMKLSATPWAAVQRAEAQAAADAVALAGAASDRQGAAEVAEANDTELVRYDVDGDEVLVTVARAGVTARARARWVPAPIP